MGLSDHPTIDIRGHTCWTEGVRAIDGLAHNNVPFVIINNVPGFVLLWTRQRPSIMVGPGVWTPACYMSSLQPF
jgi:hypothetical protein